jgi:hypothetical protein
MNLQKENRALEEGSKTTEYLQSKLEETMRERDKMQKEFDILTK